MQRFFSFHSHYISLVINTVTSMVEPTDFRSQKYNKILFWGVGEWGGGHHEFSIFKNKTKNKIRKTLTT